ncbi:MAG: FAD-dependent oxidoreductase [Candidatus Schekmanbacteria bacterium]|nr:FAD-dependent oxidoreductase [Candidatus Schekmanbacteria bacterium]
MTDHGVCILGGGVTGVAAGRASGLPVYEAAERPGGICSSYYLHPHSEIPMHERPPDGDAYRFEVGGGHWIFGGEPPVLDLIGRLSPVERHVRQSSVFLSHQGRYLPYPIQNHLAALDHRLAARALAEILRPAVAPPVTMSDWLRANFGPTLCELFFDPFHELYTAGYWKEIAPQDPFKSPINRENVVQGFIESSPAVGYNVSYLYPRDGLDALIKELAAPCDVRCGQAVTAIDPANRRIHLGTGSRITYSRVICTLPLNQTMSLADLHLSSAPDPHTSVLVLNVGGTRGESCPEDHWVYVPDSQSGFHRVGFYDNVSLAFLPRGSGLPRRVAMYVERAYPGGQRPSAPEIERYGRQVVAELQSWGFLAAPEVVHPTWIEVAYTWRRPGSKWREEALAALEENGILMVGRYARWQFQGIAESVRDGLCAGAAFRPFGNP